MKLNILVVLRLIEIFSEKCDFIIVKELVNLEKKCDIFLCNEYYW